MFWQSLPWIGTGPFVVALYNTYIKCRLRCLDEENQQPFDYWYISRNHLNSDRVDIPKEDIEARQFTFLVLYKFMI